MGKIKFIYIDRHIYYKDIFIVGLTKKFNKSEKIKFYLKYCKYFDELKPLTRKELLNEMVENIIPKPKTFPKFNNETPFKLRWDKKYILNPKILSIRWDGKWEYKLEKIGHKYDFQDENKLKVI